MILSRRGLALPALLLLCWATTGHALTIPGGNLMATGTDPVVVRYVGQSTAHQDMLYTVTPTSQFLIDSFNGSVGTSFILGTIAAGTEIVFRLDDLMTGASWFTGAASRNADNTVHAIVSDNGDGSWRVQWEDLSFFDSRYDGDFNDMVFDIWGVTGSTPPVVPEPSSLALVGIGMAGMAGVVRRRRRRRAA